ncbi:MobP3 family relaxase [[Clostridium] symbiosum]|uniref:MobP3 family relaxase n=1 Tax=Clostridium symbiosum TaxID=1512 RepID=UPI0032C1ABE8
MPKIIFTSRYMKDAPDAQLVNYVKYIATREGVEKIDKSKRELPATAAQKKLVSQLLRDFSEAKNMLEHEDYKRRPTIGAASEFISTVLEWNQDRLSDRENYVDYLANRPRVERVGEHGLFTDAGTPVVLYKVQEEVKNHQGPVWTHVVSLRREDAARLGYDSGKQWRELLRSKRAMLSKHMKIDSENLRWYAAFHNESHHPHVHIMVFSAKDNDGYLTEPAIEAMRSELAHSIFRQDFANLYEEQNQARADLKKEAEQVMKELLGQLEQGVLVNPEIERRICLLAGRLQKTNGKKVYGYLKADVKKLVDQIVDELAKAPGVEKLYQAWGEWNNQILQFYSNNRPPLPPLSKQPQFKSIKNMVIAEALQIGSHHFIFEEEPEEQAQKEIEPIELLQENEVAELPEEAEMYKASLEINTSEREATSNSYVGNQSYIKWSKEYQEARSCLYGSEETAPDFERAFQLFQREAEKGNALAMYDLARMFADGLGREADPVTAQDWYTKALAAFMEAESSAKERQKPYLQYRIGKMYAAGLGTEHKVNCPEGAREGGLGRDYGKAAEWFARAVRQNHKYAQYSLAGLYYRGQGVEQDYQQARNLYRCSAEQENPYASYELAKMYRDGIGMEPDGQKAATYFEWAFRGFLALESKSHDDKLQYRLGQMFYTGTGTKKEETKAVEFWQKAARLGNANAQYSLASHWLKTGTGDLQQALEWIRKAAEGESTAAMYSLGKLYLEGEVVPPDIKRAIKLFENAALKGHDYAAYRLGRLYLSGEQIEKNVELAMEWLGQAAGANNSYALYTLGKLFLMGADVPKDIERSIYYFKRAAEGGNEYAEFQLGKLYLLGEDVPKNVEEAITWFSRCAGRGNQFAQYVLGKLYLCGREVPKDREKAIPLLEAAAAQGNIYAQFLLDHLDSFQDPSVFLSATRLLHQLTKIFQEEERREGARRISVDRKMRRKIREKKVAQGHKRDDLEPQELLY